jgi:hypothetical protein
VTHERGYSTHKKAYNKYIYEVDMSKFSEDLGNLYIRVHAYTWRLSFSSLGNEPSCGEMIFDVCEKFHVSIFEAMELCFVWLRNKRKHRIKQWRLERKMLRLLKIRKQIHVHRHNTCHC